MVSGRGNQSTSRGEWLNESQVALDRTSPNGRVIGIDIIPAQPPKGVSTIQGNFLSRAVQDEVKTFLRDPDRGRLNSDSEAIARTVATGPSNSAMKAHTMDYFEREKNVGPTTIMPGDQRLEESYDEKKEPGLAESRIVDVVLSDMSAPWEMTDGFWKRSLSDPYFRMMNTSGMNFRDHAGSMVRFPPSPFKDVILIGMRFAGFV